MLLVVLVIVIEWISYLYHTYLFSYRREFAHKIVEKEKEIEIRFVDEEKFIPKNIIQTYKDRNIPKYIEDNLRTRNKGWEYHFLDDTEVKKFLKDEFGEAVLNVFNSFKRGCHKADLFRACWLYRHGGVYIDIDTNITEKLDNVLEMMEGETFTMPLTEEKYQKNRLLNSFMICNKGNPLMRKCIENIVKIDPLSLKKNYTLILHVMEETLGKDFKYLFHEKNTYINDPLILRRNDWYIYKDDFIIGKSKYDDYDRDVGFKKDRKN